MYRGSVPGESPPPLRVVVDPGVLKATGSEVGDRISLGMSTFALPVEIVAVTEFFPTLDPRKQPLVIADLGGICRLCQPAQSARFRRGRRSLDGPGRFTG